MTPTDPRLAAALDAATAQVKAMAVVAVERVLLSLSGASQSASRIAERDLLLAAQLDLRRGGRSFLQTFNRAFEQRVNDEFSPRTEPRRTLGAADWQTLSLVDDKEVEEQMFSGRLGQQIAHGCEWELRELAGYMGTLMGATRAEEDHNPLRPALIGQAIYSAIEALSADADARQLLTREFGSTLAQQMPGCYGAIILDLQQRRIAPQQLVFKGVEGPGNHLTGVNSGYASLQPEEPMSTRSSGGDGGGGGGTTSHSQHGFGSTTRSGAGRNTVHGGAHSTGYGNHGSAAAPMAADAQLMSLLRRLTQLASRQGDFDAVPLDASASAPATTSASPAGLPSRSTTAYSGLHHADASADTSAAADAGGLTGLMAVNLIRAHREELLQASTGKLDHMVIDVVGSLFDQILSDTRVPPQMARQIARLQLPVLRVALADASFFSSRRHPVRRFVNRIASLACAFDDFSSGPGRQFLARVSQIVQDIVDGDFEQPDLYTDKVVELEAFIAQQSSAQVQRTGAAAVLVDKESELHTQQRYLHQLKAALAAVQMPDYLRAFLCQVWSQALVLATRRDGADSDLARRLRNVGRDVVMSVQPKGSPPMRRRFLMQLPTLMKDLTEGLALIGWPDTAKKQFLDQLLPSHAESLKGAALTELDYNMLARQLELIFGAAIPGPAGAAGGGHAATAPVTLSGGSASMHLPAAASEPVSGDADSGSAVDAAIAPVQMENRFSAQEAAQVGLVPESAVDWAGLVELDIDLSAPPPSRDGTDTVAADLAADLAADAVVDPATGIDLKPTSAEASEPLTGAALMAHIRLGFAYQMLLKDEWQKVTLSYVSPGRSFFVFSRGQENPETISVTARMLARMCETSRLRAVENAYLMERATARARKQLAALRH